MRYPPLHEDARFVTGTLVINFIGTIVIMLQRHLITGINQVPHEGKPKCKGTTSLEALAHHSSGPLPDPCGVNWLTRRLHHRACGAHRSCRPQIASEKVYRRRHHSVDMVMLEQCSYRRLSRSVMNSGLPKTPAAITRRGWGCRPYSRHERIMESSISGCTGKIKKGNHKSHRAPPCLVGNNVSFG